MTQASTWKKKKQDFFQFFTKSTLDRRSLGTAWSASLAIAAGSPGAPNYGKPHEHSSGRDTSRDAHGISSTNVYLKALFLVPSQLSSSP